MNDILEPGYYDEQNIDELIHSIHKAGLYNLSQLIKSQFEKIKEIEIEMEEAVEAANDQGYQTGFDDGYSEMQRDNSKVENFADWFLNEFEPEHKKKIKFKTIGETTFVIMTESDYDDLKNQFHEMCD